MASQVTFLLFWLGFAICLGILLIQACKSGRPWVRSTAEKFVDLNTVMDETGRILRHSKSGKLANALLAAGTISLVLTTIFTSQD